MKSRLTKLFSLLMVISILFAGFAPATKVAAAAPAADKKEITWATIAGFYTDWAENVAKDFETKTGYKVNIVKMDLPTMYEKEGLDFVGGTGAYDVVTWNVSWKAGWANNGFLLPIDNYIAKEDPKALDFGDITPILVKTGGGWAGKTYGLPYYTYTQGMFYRCDLFEDPTEMAAFEKKYGYKLDIPTTYDQMADQAQFFTRKAGETLKGQKLDKDMYGIGTMSGRFTNLFDEVNMIAWGMGGDVTNKDGTPGVNQPPYVKALTYDVEKLVPYAPAGSLTGSYDFVVSQLNSGIIAMTGPFYLDQWANAVKTEKQIPGSEICAAPNPSGGRVWAGAFNIGISKASKNPDMAWEFMKFITSKETQLKFAKGGGSAIRDSIMTDKAFYTANRETAGHFPVVKQINDWADKCWLTNMIYVPQVDKIYEEAPQWLSAAVTKQSTPQEAMDGFAKAITKLCGGKACDVKLDGIELPSPTADCSFKFDKSLQVRKTK
jgi:multiple sugar transport system substrate-binding protein